MATDVQRAEIKRLEGKHPGVHFGVGLRGTIVIKGLSEPEAGNEETAE